jgi:excisionase family DNA binding protein
MAASTERFTYSVTEAAEVLGISRTLAYELVARGELPHVRFGRRVLVPRRALAQLVEGVDGASSSEQASCA